MAKNNVNLWIKQDIESSNHHVKLTRRLRLAIASFDIQLTKYSGPSPPPPHPPPPPPPPTNVDNVMQNTVQAFGGFLTNIGLVGGGK